MMWTVEMEVIHEALEVYKLVKALRKGQIGTTTIAPVVGGGEWDVLKVG